MYLHDAETGMSAAMGSVAVVLVETVATWIAATLRRTMCKECP